MKHSLSRIVLSAAILAVLQAAQTVLAANPQIVWTGAGPDSLITDYANWSLLTQQGGVTTIIAYDLVFANASTSPYAGSTVPSVLPSTPIATGTFGYPPAGNNVAGIYFGLPNTDGLSLSNSLIIGSSGYTLNLGKDGVNDNSTVVQTIASALQQSNNQAETWTIGTGGNLWITGGIVLGQGAAGQGITVSGAGVLTLTGATPSGWTGGSAGVTVNGNLVVANGTALGGAKVIVNSGATFRYAAAADTPLTLANTLAITGGTGTAIGGSIGSTATSSEVNVTGKATSTAAAVLVNVYGESGITPLAGTNTYTLVHSATATGSTLNSATYSLGTVYNNSNFTVGAITKDAQNIYAAITNATPLTNAYWVGGFTNNTNVWAASNGASASNWAATSSGIAQALTPGSTTNVVFSGTAASNQTSTVLGANLSINSLAVSGTVGTPNETNNLTLNNDGNKLTIGSGGILINSGSGSVSLNPAGIVLGAAQTWTNNANSTLSIGAVVSGGSSSTLAIAGTGTTSLNASNTYAGNTIINAGTLTAGIANALPSSSAVTVNGGTLDVSGYSQTVKSLSVAAAGKLKLGLGATLSTASSGTANIASGATVSIIGSTSPATVGIYHLINALGGLTQSATLSNPDATNYSFVTSADTLDLQHNATLSFSLGSNAGNVRVGSQTVNLNIGNTAPLNSAALNYTISGGGLSGSSTRAAGGSSDSLGISGSYTAVAGPNSFTITASDPNATNSPQSIAFLQTAYAYAAPTYNSSPVAFGNVRVGAVSNVALTNPGTTNYQDNLAVSASGLPSTVTTNSISSLAANGPAQNLTFTAANAGSLAGTASLSLVSNPLATATGLTGQTTTGSLTISGNAYAYASPSVTPVSLGVVHISATPISQNLTITNTLNAPSAIYQDSLDGTATSITGVTVTGSFSGLGAGQTSTSDINLSVNVSSPGPLPTLSVPLILTSRTSISGLDDGHDLSTTVAVNGSVYSGVADYTGGDGGTWAATGNWADHVTQSIHVAPGSFTNFNTDTANFTASSAQAVDLQGAAVNVGQINYTGASTTIQDSLGTGTLILNGSSAAINVLSGNHSISANIQLAANTTVTVTNSSDSLNLSGVLTAPAGSLATLTKDGDGTLILSGLKNYSRNNLAGPATAVAGGGTVTINAGTLALNTDPLLGGNTAVTLNNGTLDFTSGYTSNLNITLGAANSTIQVDSGTQIISTALGGSNLTKTGAGQLTVQNLTSNVSITNGLLQVATDANNNVLETLSSLNISGGTLDLTNHDLLVAHGAANLANYRGKVITSAVATAHNDGTAATTIALVSGRDYKEVTGTTTFNSDDLVGVFAYKGDANLDGTITVDDYIALDVGYLFGLTGWIHGDFEQTGTITAQDYADIDNSYLHQSGSLAAGEIALHTQWFGADYLNAFNALNAPAAVPEPASLALLVTAALSLLHRQPRRRSPGHPDHLLDDLP